MESIERLKLSQFRVNKKISFVNGEVKNEEVLNGILEFYQIDAKKVEEINTNILANLKGSEQENKIRFMYEAIPYLSNVENDITMEEFDALVKTPTITFMTFLDALIDSVNYMFKVAEKASIVEQKLKLINTKLPDLEIIQETPQQKVQRLENELKDCADIKRKRELFRQISELYSEIGE